MSMHQEHESRTGRQPSNEQAASGKQQLLKQDAHNGSRPGNPIEPSWALHCTLYIEMSSPKQAEIQALVLSLTLSDSLGPFWITLQEEGRASG